MTTKAPSDYKRIYITLEEDYKENKVDCTTNGNIPLWDKVSKTWSNWDDQIKCPRKWSFNEPKGVSIYYDRLEEKDSRFTITFLKNRKLRQLTKPLDANPIRAKL